MMVRLPTLVLVFGACLAMDMDPDAEKINMDHIDEASLERIFKKIDTDADGFVTFAEALSHHDLVMVHHEKNELSIGFEGLDSDSDGRVSLAEYLKEVGVEHDDEDAEDEVRIRGFEEQKFKFADKDGDGSLSRTELPNLADPAIEDQLYTYMTEVMLKKYDRNGDGKLSVESEMGNVLDDIDKESFKLADQDGDGALNAVELKRWDSGKHQQERDMLDFFHVVDQDHDKKITVKEVLAAKPKLEARSTEDVGSVLHSWHDTLDEL